MYFSATYPGYFAYVLETGASEIATTMSGTGQAYCDPSGEYYVIMEGNLHTATADARTHVPTRYFFYDAQDRLVAVFDRGGTGDVPNLTS